MNTLALLLLLSQDYTYDINGRRTSMPMDAGETEERVVEEGGGRKVIERVTRRAGQVEKVRIEEVKHPDGRVSTTQESYRGDINGRLVLDEKRQTELKKTGDLVESVTTTSRGSLNGGLEVVERQETRGRETSTLKQTDTRVFRKDTNGSFSEAARSIAEQRLEGSKMIETVTDYNNVTQDGRLREASRRITTEVKAKDGATVRQVELYGVQPGRPAEPGQLKLREQQLIEQRPGPGKTVQESLSIRRPDTDGTLPPGFTKVSDRVCQQKCN